MRFTGYLVYNGRESQIENIYDIFGKPKKTDWPKWDEYAADKKNIQRRSGKFERMFNSGELILGALMCLMQLNPDKRLKPERTLCHKFFR